MQANDAAESAERAPPALRHVYRCTANALAGSLQAAQAMLTAAVAAQEKATAAVEKQAAYLALVVVVVGIFIQ